MKLKILLFSIFFSIFLFSCSRNDIVEPGSISSDSNIISNGRFSESVVDTDSDFADYLFSDATFHSGLFYYLVKNNILSDIKIISFDSKAQSFTSSSLDMPLKLSDQDFSFDVHDINFDFSGYEGVSLYYYNPYFVDNFIEGYCYVSGYKYSDYAPTVYLDQYFKIKWNIDGSVESVQSVDFDFDHDSINGVVSYDYISCDNNGNHFLISDSGLIRYSEEGKYLDTYFDYINSSYSGSFSNIVYADENLFSSMSCIEDNLSFSVFTRDDTSLKNYTPISLYCSSMSDDLRRMILNYNSKSKDYKIGVRNYSDIYRDYNEKSYDQSILNDFAFRNLKADVLSGDIPDIIYETSGLDSIFVNGLASSGTIVELKDMMKSDKDIKGSKFLTNIYDLFDDNNIFAIIPSFKFDTCVASVLNQQITRNWSLEDYVNYKSNFESDTIIMDSYSSDDFILRALAFNGDSWIDASSGNALFGDDFKKYLELASQLPDSYDDFNEKSTTGEIPVNVHIFYTSVGNPANDFLLSWRRVWSEPVNVGFPTNSGSDRVIHPSGALMICTDRVALPGCWEFAKTMLMSEYQDSLTDCIPVLESSYEKWKSNTSYDGIDMNYLILNVNGQIYSAPMLGTDKMDLLSNTIKSCKKYYFVNPEIEDIVLKNASLYFEGQISVDDAAANTEAEVEEYLKSMMQAS